MNNKLGYFRQQFFVFRKDMSKKNIENEVTNDDVETFLIKMMSEQIITKYKIERNGKWFRCYVTINNKKYGCHLYLTN